MISKIIDNLKTLLIALFIAIIIRSLLFQPFYIPSSSMEPTLLVGDRIFVSKYTYGYSKHSFPFSPPILNKRIFSSEPEYGDLIVFKTPSDNRTDFIKRLVGLPGDKIQIKNGYLFINQDKVEKEEITENFEIKCGGEYIDVKPYKEEMSMGPTNNVGDGKIAGTVQAGDDPPVRKKKKYIYAGRGSRKNWMT